MSATTEQKKHSCSCGRTFANEQILKYHQRVSNHGVTEEGAAPAEEENPLAGLAGAVAIASRAQAQGALPAVAAPVEVAVVTPVVVAPIFESDEADRAEAAYLAAVDILRNKRAERESLERQLASDQVVGELVDFAGELAIDAGRFSKRVASLGAAVLARVAVIVMALFLTAGMFTAGVGLVNLVASSGGSAPGSSGAWTTVAHI